MVYALSYHQNISNSLSLCVGLYVIRGCFAHLLFEMKFGGKSRFIWKTKPFQFHKSLSKSTHTQRKKNLSTKLAQYLLSLDQKNVFI